MQRLIAITIAALSIIMVSAEADARRMGGGKNAGIQRSAPDKAPQGAPAQQQHAPAQQAQPQTAPQPAAAAGAAQPNKWLGPLAGLALGAGLAALFLNNGIAGLLAGLMLLLGIAALAFFAFRALRGRMAGAGAPAGEQHTRFESMGSAQPGSVSSMGSSGLASVPAATHPWPADFDAAGFLRHARLNFAKLQEANDRRDAAALADFLAPDLLEDIKAQWQAEGSTQGKTEVLMLQAELLQVITDGLLHVAQIRFSGQLREDGVENDFSEIWNLEKPVRGNSGWLVAGIQQD